MPLSRRATVHTVARRLRLQSVAVALRHVEPSPGWDALLTKAFAIVTSRRPELLPPLGVHVAAVFLDEEQPGNEPRYALVRAPERLGLKEIEDHLERARQTTSVRARRLLWWWRRLRGWRAPADATFAVLRTGKPTLVPALDWEEPEAGAMTVRLHVDARVMTAAVASELLDDLEWVLRNHTLNELGYLRRAA